MILMGIHRVRSLFFLNRVSKGKLHVELKIHEIQNMLQTFSEMIQIKFAQKLHLGWE